MKVCCGLGRRPAVKRHRDYRWHEGQWGHRERFQNSSICAPRFRRRDCKGGNGGRNKSQAGSLHAESGSWRSVLTTEWPRALEFCRGNLLRDKPSCAHWRSQHVRCVVRDRPSNHGRSGCAQVQQRGRRHPYTNGRAMKALVVQSSGKETCDQRKQRDPSHNARHIIEKIFSPRRRLLSDPSMAGNTLEGRSSPQACAGRQAGRQCGSSGIAAFGQGIPAPQTSRWASDSGTLACRLGPGTDGSSPVSCLPLPRRRLGGEAKLESSSRPGTRAMT